MGPVDTEQGHREQVDTWPQDTVAVAEDNLDTEADLDILFPADILYPLFPRSYGHNSMERSLVGHSDPRLATNLSQTKETSYIPLFIYSRMVILCPATRGRSPSSCEV